MAKQRKKRNKKYSGADATTAKPVITRVSAVNRAPISQWFHDHRKRLTFSVKVATVAAGAVVLIMGVISLFK